MLVDWIQIEYPMKLIISLHPTAPPASPHLFLRCSSSWGVSCFKNTKKTIRNNEMRAVPARDRVIDFGKHKGKMLGMLSSEYLRWLSKNLRTGDFEKWGKLAEDVLEDEVYADRMEWEQAERLLSGEGMVGWGCGVAAEMEETSKMLGWDYDDKVGWSKVDFGLLGTSKGGRIPRVHGKQQHKEESNFKKPAGKGCSGGGVGVGREKRRERAAKKREQQTAVSRSGSNEEEMNSNNNGRKEEDGDEMGRSRRSSFPGRQSLINKVLHGHGYT